MAKVFTMWINCIFLEQVCCLWTSLSNYCKNHQWFTLIYNSLVGYILHCVYGHFDWPGLSDVKTCLLFVLIMEKEFDVSKKTENIKKYYLNLLWLIKNFNDTFQ